jgi:5,10-methenyltetrahydrofolate synthetase
MDAIEHENPLPSARAAWRAQLKADRQRWLASPEGAGAAGALGERLTHVLQQLEPLCLGLYWPLPGEFDAPALWAAQPLPGVSLALPFAEPGGAMRYRLWDGAAPSARDGMGIPTATGGPANPDVVLVPCLGVTREGYRLGYGGGYFDRWLAAHPGVTAVGLAWRVGECRFDPEPHDVPLSVVVTDAEVWAP